MNDFYIASFSLDEESLCHYGRKGMKWYQHIFGKETGIKNADGSLTDYGIHKYGSKNISKSRSSNLDKWGKSPDTNTLYIVGYSGSGKSTTALSLKKKGDTVLHLDGYVEPGSPSNIRNEKFDRYLNETVPNWKQMKNATNNTSIKRHSKEYWDIVDNFNKAITDYSKKEFKNGNRVIVEGVQIADGWLASQDYFKGKPMIILGTNPIKSMSRAFERDERGNLIKGLGSLDSAKEYINWYMDTNKKLNELSLSTDSVKTSKKFVESLF